MKKILLLSLITLIPLSVGAENITASEADSMVTQMKTILDGYALRIKALETENNILKEEMRKAGIKVPLSLYSGAIIQVPTTMTGGTLSGSTKTQATMTGNQANLPEGAIKNISSQYGERYAGFITKIHSDWSGIQGAYNLPSTSYIGGYEFVKQGTDNHVFVDIINNALTATESYDTKILYEYHTGTYQRKLIGLFEFDKKTGYYITKTGSNPFAGVTRIFVRDPYRQPIAQNTTTTGSVSPVVVPTYADIEKAYADKRYLSVISLSNAYLTANSPTSELLRIRYRTYFIIGKYNESLAEIAKIEAMGQLSNVACDAQVIATYSKNQSLVDKYTKACK